MGRRRRRGCFGRFLIVALSAAAALCAYMAIASRLVHLETAQVYLKDLPEAFEGTTIVWLTDLHVGAFSSGKDSAALVNSLQSLYPDLLLLGGDYVGGGNFSAQRKQEVVQQRDFFFQELNWFYAPLGKFGVRGNHDDQQGLSEAMAAGGITLLDNQVARLEKEGQYLYVAGLDDWNTGRQNLAALSTAVREQDAVLALSHNPDAFPAALRHGSWFDLMLSGHTHGGQVSLPGLNAVLTPSIYGNRYLSGWVREQGTLLMVSNGVGCTALPFRLNAPAQAHLITLHRG